ncbi:MAG: glycosyltransferase [Planctomycetota bacterium]
MIFVTVGAQMPFDRLMRSVDAWAATRGGNDVFAQIGDTTWRPGHMQWTAILKPCDFRQRLYEADVVVTHAGMGTILTALEFGKPVVVMPRRGDLAETRNDHQLGTAAAFAEAGLVSVAWNERELPEVLQHFQDVAAPTRAGSHASLRLLSTLKQFIHDDPSFTG